MSDDFKREWATAKEELIHEMEFLGFSRELGVQVAANLGSPKAIKRMTAYLYYVKPRTEELVVDEMLAICSEISSWRDKKMSEEANAKITEMLNSDIPFDLEDDI